MPDTINTETCDAKATSSMTQSAAEVKALLDSRSDGVRIKDIDRLMSLYAPDVVRSALQLLRCLSMWISDFWYTHTAIALCGAPTTR
jgi:ketosteroid isomerase-like protein